jgi:LytR cell envelope-related transcriptional attenuator
MHVIESIGPLVGIAAFLGLAVLAFLLFQQARDLRRLREWAGRAPERAQEAAEAVQAAGEAARAQAGEVEPSVEPAPSVLGRVGSAWSRLVERVGSGLRTVDRRLPVDGRYLLAIAVAALVGVGVVTSGFGLVGGNGGDGHHGRGAAAKPEVAVLNGTSVTGLADLADRKVVRDAGYKTGVVTNAGASFANTVVMYLPGGRSAAKKLAGAIEPKLGTTPVQVMTADVKARAGGAPLALALGLDDASLGSG